ncbi:MAG: UDP-N-acetylmuramoyl-L-alanine--D-glutamate ligase [Cytophagales bacterium]|nr:UDP-N-acetylmuramoyl-L-alanine--D-glutamate ligase [Cytophagales bacterium]
MLKRTVILGAGESGVGAALLAKAKGYNVFVSDNGTISKSYKKTLIENSITFEEEKHTEDLILNADEVIKSPGIPDKNPVIRKLLKKAIPVISEIEFAARFTNAKFIAITGSNGKTTTTLLIYHLCKQAGLNVGLAGNIGNSLSRQVYNDEMSHYPSYYIVELSSFQLDGIQDFKPDIAVLLNITPDHLDRYEHNFDNYIESKFRITKNMTEDDYLIYWAEDDIIAKEISERTIKPFKLPVSLSAERIAPPTGGAKRAAPYPASWRGHTPYAINTMAAIQAATLAGVDKSTIARSLKDFKNAPHRLEYVATKYGIKFINDSKATNVDAVRYALDSLVEKVVWIAGGVDKGNDYEQLNDLVKERVKAIVCLGNGNSKIHTAFNGHIKQIADTKNMEEAVNKAFKIAKKGFVVLLSPACASFDLFENYEDRGEQFKRAVARIGNPGSSSGSAQSAVGSRQIC